MRRHLELCSTLNSSFFHGIRMLNTNPSSLRWMRFNLWALCMIDWYLYYLWLQNMLSSYFLAFHLQLLLFSSHLRLQVHKVLPSFTFPLHWISSKSWVLFHNICKKKNLIRVVLKLFSRIQVKIYGCSIGDSIFLAAQLVPCKELHSLLTLFDQA